jgi:hypothetical protein
MNRVPVMVDLKDNTELRPPGSMAPRADMVSNNLLPTRDMANLLNMDMVNRLLSKVMGRALHRGTVNLRKVMDNRLLSKVMDNRLLSKVMGSHPLSKVTGNSTHSTLSKAAMAVLHHRDIKLVGDL